MKKEYLVWALKGAAMGAADAVPGVSGGTMALITGIYERFIAALASFKLSLFIYLKKRDFRGLWQAIDGTFLLCLGIGILVSLFSVLNLMHWLLEIAAPVVWAFFMGIILASLWYLFVSRKWKILDIGLFLAGLSIAASLAMATGVQLEVSPVTLVLGGAIAISAMLLPGISGSFMLLLMGLYPVVVDAVHELNFSVVLWTALGCLIGILSFSRFLQWALSRWHDLVMSFLVGFVAGALIKVWPWQYEGDWLFPDAYTLASGLDAWFWLSLLCFIFGGMVIVNMNKFTRS